MFEGVQDQFHQFLAAATSNSTPISPSSSPHHPNPIPIPLPLPPPPPPPLSFSLLHGCTSSSPSPSNSFPSVVFHHDPYNPVQAHLHHQILQQQLQWAPPAQAKQQPGGAIKQERELATTNINTTTTTTHHGFGFLALERERSMAEVHDHTHDDLIDSASWSHDELLALLRIRSALENWFPEFTWEHVSRKLSELGFKRSPRKCKEKFEEESRSYFHTTKNNDVTGMENDVSCPTKNYRLFSELEELCHRGHDPPPPPHHHHHHHLHQQPPALISPHEDGNVDKQNPQTEVQGHGEMDDNDEQQEERLGSGGELGQEEIVNDKMGQLERSLDENDGTEATDKMEEHQITETQQRKKSRRNRDQIMNNKKKFEIFKSFCEEIVDKMMSQQEELHNKILQDMIKRDEEKMEREEAWRNQETERINKEMEARATDLAMVSDRQAKIIEYLKKFAIDSSTNTMITHKNDANNEAPKSTHQNPSSSATHSSPVNHLPTSSNEGSISQTSNPTPNTTVFRKPRPNKRPRNNNCSDGNDVGKRWPREEVLALINIRCNVDVTNKTRPDDPGQNNNTSNKNPPLWERISQKMMKKGYNRSAKRCKEKWENINKYFRKTKDMNKNRSVDSRTCPYFHQLSHLYNQGQVTGGGGGGCAMNVDVSDQGEDVGGVQVTMSAACDI